MSDITERQRVEEALRFKNVLLAAQQEVSLDGILVVDAKGEMLSYNRRFADMWNIPPEVIGSRSDERALQSVLIMLSEPQHFLEKVNYLYEHREETSQDEIALKDGRTFDRYSSPLVGPDKEYYGRVWYFRDITERKRVEDQLRQAKEEWERTFNAIIDPVIILDANYRIIKANKAMAAILGISPSEAEGLTCYSAVHGKAEPPLFCPHSKLLADGQPHSVEIYEERLGGYYIISVSPLYIPGGNYL